MTRKDYVALARAIHLVREMVVDNTVNTPSEAVVLMAAAITIELSLDNSRFDRARFYKACGVYPKGTTTEAAAELVTATAGSAP